MSVSEKSVTRLPRRLGLLTATSVVVANMIGTGIFTTTGLMLSRVESGWIVLLCWILGEIVTICGALAGFLTGWVSLFVGFSAPIAATGVACAKYLAVAGILPGRWAGDFRAAGRPGEMGVALLTRPGPLLCALLTVAAGLPAYRLMSRRRGSGPPA